WASSVSSQSCTCTAMWSWSSTSSPFKPRSASAATRCGPSVSRVSSTVDIVTPSSVGGGELLGLGRAGQRQRRAFPAGDGLDHLVEVAGADLPLVAGRGVALLFERE